MSRLDDRVRLIVMTGYAPMLPQDVYNDVVRNPAFSDVSLIAVKQSLNKLVKKGILSSKQYYFFERRIK